MHLKTINLESASNAILSGDLHTESTFYYKLFLMRSTLYSFSSTKVLHLIVVRLTCFIYHFFKKPILRAKCVNF